MVAHTMIRVLLVQNEEGESSDEQPLQSSAPLASSSKIKREVSPGPKKPKVEGTLTDAELARQLSMELNPAPGRTTRHGPVRPKAKAKPKKRAKAVDEYDSDGNIKPKKKAGGGFNKPHLLSDALADVCGETVLSRPGVTKALWVSVYRFPHMYDTAQSHSSCRNTSRQMSYKTRIARPISCLTPS